jgi:Domain of unknown function (DUF222)/HNH endonuclease
MKLLDDMTSAIDALVDAGPSACADGDSLVVLIGAWNKLGALITRSTAEFDTWGGYTEDGAKNAASWINTKVNEPMKESRRRVKHGRLLRDFPLVAEAFGDGEINSAHLDLIMGALNPRTKEAMQRDEAFIVEQAKALPYDDFSRFLVCYKQAADPDGAEEDAMAQKERRDAYFVPGGDGMFFGRQTLDPISGTIIYDELNRIERDLFEADWAEAKERLGHDPKVSDLARTPGQRRADAFVEMAVRSRTAPAGGRRPEPRFSILVGYDQVLDYICELENGIVVTPGTVYEWLDRAYFERVVFGPDRRVEVSETARFFTGATRRGIQVRDRRCTHPFCNEPVERCQADHIRPASEGGPTTQENGRLLCAFHNRLRNQRPPPDD